MTTRSLFSKDFTEFAIIACSIFVLIVLTFAFALWRYRAGRGHTPSVMRKHETIEVGYLTVVAGIVGFLIFTSITTNDSRLSTAKPALRIAVTGYQWCWRFAYEGTKAAVTDTCNNGHYPVFEVPRNKVIEFDVSGADVIHGFWIPSIRYKVYAYPGHVNHFEDSFNRLGTFPGRCAVFCGLYHKDMDFFVRVVTDSQFRSWLHHQENAAGVTS